MSFGSRMIKEREEEETCICAPVVIGKKIYIKNISFTKILMRNVDLWPFFTSETSAKKIYSSQRLASKFLYRM